MIPGFFSIFMLGNSVRVRTRRADAAQKDTLVLEFNTGLSSRPVLREAAYDEVLRDGGTIIRVWLDTAPDIKGGLLYQHRNPTSLMDICQKIAPALPVNLICKQNGTETLCVRGNDWLTCSGSEFFERLSHRDEYQIEKIDNETRRIFLKKAEENLRIIYDSKNAPIGRACISVGRYGKSESLNLNGVVTVGGLQSCTLHGITGILNGIPERAARDVAIPMITADTLSQWATEQALLIPNLYNDPSEQMECASIIRRCNGETKTLPVAQYNKNYMSYEDISAMTLPDEIYIINSFKISDFENLNGFKVASGVFVTQIGSWMSILQTPTYIQWPDELFERKYFSIMNTLGGSVIESAVKAWGCSLDDIKDQINEYKEQEKTIGYLHEEEIKDEVFILKMSSDI